MMDDALRAFVWARAGSRCETCRLHQDEYEYQTFHVEHIIAKQHGGADDPDNLCLACSECNWAKGPNLAGLIIEKTLTGKVTVQVLNINDSARLMLRENLLFEGRFPPNK
jgi:hypothetical protein